MDEKAERQRDHGTGAARSTRPTHRDRFGRRRLLGVGAGGALAAVVGCGGEEAPSPTALAAATPTGPIPGFDDPRRWAGRTLRVGGWGGEVQAALRDALWSPFASATGCAIAETTSDYGRLAEAVAAGRMFADVLLVDEFWAASAAAETLAQPTGLDALAPTAVAAFGGDERSVPAFAYALVGAYRREGLGADEPPRTWADWWDVGRYPGPRALARDAFGTFEFALLADGVAPADLYPLDGARAIESLKAISGRIVDRWWDSGREPVLWLGNARADLASSWHYRVIAGQRDGLGVELEWSQGLVVADRWVVPVTAEAPEIAVDFVRYASTPEAQATLCRRIPLGPVVPAAFASIDGALAATLPTAPANLARLLRPDVAWWATRRGEAMQQFNGWLLGVEGER